MYWKTHLALLSTMVENPHVEGKERPAGTLTDPTGPGGGTSACFKRLRVEMRSFHGSLGLSTPPTPTNSRNLKPSKDRNYFPQSKTKKHL